MVIQSWISLLVVQEQLVIWLILAKKVCCYKMVQNRSEAINLYFPQITLLEHYSKNKWTFPAYVFCMCLYVSWWDKLLLKAHSYSNTPKKVYFQGMLFQKHLFLHQLAHNMTKDCSWNYHENFKRRTWPEHGQNMFCAWGNSMNNLFWVN